MARRYAVIMGLVGLTVVLVRSAKNGSGVDASIGTALATMMIFAIVGAVVGAIAQTTVDESMRMRIERELREIAAARAAAEKAHGAT